MNELMKKQHTKLKKERGITLIALVVTIIVLLILAGISIMMLTGQTGILKQAGKASRDTGRARMIETARIDLQEEMISNNGNITEDMFKGVLSKYFSNVPDNLPADLSTLILEDGTYNDILASEIYDGTFGKIETTGTEESLDPGLYSREDALVLSWNQLIEQGYITDDSNVLTGLKDMEGKLVIREGVTEITRRAFENCKKIFEFVIPASVTTIGDGGLYTKEGLEAITVKEGNPNFKSIDGVLFTKTGKTLIQYPMNKSDETYTIPNDTLSVGYGAFYQVNLQTINVNNITKMCSFAFSESEISQVNFSNSLKDLGSYAFQDCHELKEVDLPSGIEKFGGDIFNSCSKLQSAKLPNPFPTEILPEFLFPKCTSLTTVNIPNNITEIGCGCFYRCTSLTTIDLPTGLVTIENYAFKNIKNLNTVIPDTVTTLKNGCFYGNTKITSVPTGITTVGELVFGTDCALDEASRQRLLDINNKAIGEEYTSGGSSTSFGGYYKYQEQL